MIQNPEIIQSLLVVADGLRRIKSNAQVLHTTPETMIISKNATSVTLMLKKKEKRIQRCKFAEYHLSYFAPQWFLLICFITCGNR